MKVLVWKFRLHLLSDPRSLKDKRSVVLKFLEKVRKKHAFSAAEVGDHELFNVAQFGLCSVGTDKAKLEAALEKCRRSAEASLPVEFFDEEVYLEQF